MKLTGQGVQFNNWKQETFLKVLLNGFDVAWEGRGRTKPSDAVIHRPPMWPVPQKRWSRPVPAVQGAVEDEALRSMLHAFCFCVVLPGRKVAEKNKKLSNNVKIPNTIRWMSSHLRARNQNPSVILGVSEAQVVCEPREMTAKLGDEWKCEEESKSRVGKGRRGKKVRETCFSPFYSPNPISYSLRNFHVHKCGIT